MLGVLLTLLSSLCFGINNAAVRRGVITATVAQAVAVSMPVGLVGFALFAALAGQLAEVARFSPYSLLMLASAGVVHFCFGRYCAYRSVRAMGANLSAPVTQWSLMVSLVLAVIFLGERLDLLKLIGIALLVLGPSLVVAGQRKRRRGAAQAPAAETKTPQFKPKLLEGYTFGVLSCFGWGSSPILVRAGLEGNGMALAGGVVSYAAATVVILLILLLPGPRHEVASISKGNLKWFTGTGAGTCVSQMLLYLAMAIAPVTVVQPLLRLQYLFGTLAGWFMNRDHEIFDSGVIGALFLSILGALFLALDASMVARWIDGPAWMTAALGWRWP